jgi:putative MFS transporter
MGTAAQPGMFEQIEQRPVTRRQVALVAAAVVGNMLEFFDYFLIGFILTIIVEPWGLTFGASAVLLLTSGVGAIIGSIAFGWLADRTGRRRCFMATVLMFSLATGAMALVPEGNWVLLALLRLVVGFGVGGLISVDVPLVQEFVPSRLRGFLGGMVVAFIPIGLMLGSISAAVLGPAIGWRGLVLLGLAPALLTLFVRAFVPESPRWLLHHGRREEARASVAWALDIAPEQVKLPEEVVSVRSKWRDMFRFKRSVALTWLTSFSTQTAEYGLILWGPTLLALQLDVSPARAAFLFIFVSLSGFVARILISALGDRIGRRLTGGAIYAFGAVALVVAGVTHDATIASIAVFYVMLIVAFMFIDGGFAVVQPYHSEVFPTNVRASGLGMAYGVGGLGKIVGPAGLALISGAGTLVTPEATLAALAPGFVFFAAFAALASIGYFVFGIETRGRPIELLDAELAERGSAAAERVRIERRAPIAGREQRTPRVRAS